MVDTLYVDSANSVLPGASLSLLIVKDSVNATISVNLLLK